MSDNIKGIPYSVAEFDKEGRLIAAPSVPTGLTDLIFISHGWNNDRQEAEALYTKLFSNFVTVTAGNAAIAQRKLAIVGIIWPSKKLDELMSAPPAADRVAGGAAAAGGHVDRNGSVATMQAAIDRCAAAFDEPGDDARIAALRALVPQLDDDDAAKADFVRTLRALLDPEGTRAAKEGREDAGAVFFRSQPDVIFENASQPSAQPAPARTEGDAVGAGEGHAAGLGSLLSSAVNGVTNLLNLTTYFKMKNRSGVVGEKGVAPLVDQLAAGAERVHLIGHSFGCRVVSAAAAHSTTDKIRSMSLLQAAFSHYGFSAEKHGFFRTVVDGARIRGPVLITHTKNDKAVGLAYPAASRISQDKAAGFGDADDEFGALGSNGAQSMKQGEISDSQSELLGVGSGYVWRPGKLHNLESSRFIRDPAGGDAHGWIHVPEVAWAVSTAIIS